MQLTGNLIADTICKTGELGLTITDAADAGSSVIINAISVTVDDSCPGCETCGTSRDDVIRCLVDLRVVGYLSRLHGRIRSFTCNNDCFCCKIFQDKHGYGLLTFVVEALRVRDPPVVVDGVMQVPVAA